MPKANVTTPNRPAFYRIEGGRYMSAALAVEKAGGTLFSPTYTLIGQAIELYLKAFLLDRGESEQTCFKLGHDLSTALEKALKHGLTLDNRDQSTIRLFSKPYSGMSFRYQGMDGWAAPEPKDLMRTAVRLRDATAS